MSRVSTKCHCTVRESGMVVEMPAGLIPAIVNCDTKNFRCVHYTVYNTPPNTSHVRRAAMSDGRCVYYNNITWHGVRHHTVVCIFLRG